MSGDSEGFDRAPGAGRTRGKVSGPGHGDVNKLRQPELGEGPSVFSQCEPLRQPRTAAPTIPPAPSTTSAPSAPNAPTPDSTVPVLADTRSSPTSSESVQNNSRVAALKTRPVQEFTLSASAPEFFPSTYTNTNTYLPVQDDVYEDGWDDPGYYPEMSLADLVQDIMAHLSSSPGSFETDIDQITATLNSWVTTEETLHELVELIFTQSTSIPNFTYTGARLCNFLSHHLALSPASGNFRQLLLQRCRTEFEQRQEVLMGDQETQRRFHNYVLFLGELYLSLEVKRGTLLRADVLLSALKDLMHTLFSQPNDANLICAIKLLKLTGSVLEDAWRQSSASHMDTLMEKMKNIVLDGNCSRDVKQMMLKLVELRSSNWGRVHAAASYSEATPDNDPNYYMNEPTFYTADGTPFTAADPEYSEKYQEILDREDYFPECYEENGNESLYCEEDEMEPEMMEAFEKFCLETERKRKT